MEIILFRHGEKQTLGVDPELTRSGHLQAESISRLVQQLALPKPTQIFASPRKRALQTMEPLSLWSKVRLKTARELDQQFPQETGKAFRLRIQEFLVRSTLEWKDSDIIYLCTHHDWILEFLSVVESDTDLLQALYMHWEAAQYMHFEKTDLWHLRKFGIAR